MNKYYTISEIAKIFGITTNKIRFYEKKGLLLPFREIDSEYRKFDENDIIRLQSILLYRSIGLSIENIKDILDNTQKENYISHFNNQWEIVNNEIHRLSSIRSSLENVIDKLYEGNSHFEEYDKVFEIISESNNINNIKDSWKDRWNFSGWAKSYDEDVKKDRGQLKIYANYNLILQTVYDLVENLNIKNGKVIEIGVGTGNLASKFLDNNYNIIGIDQSREMLAVAKQKYPDLKVRLGEFLKIPYENSAFDVIVSTYAFHHLNESEKIIAMEEMIRVLKDDGVIVIGDLMFESKKDKLDLLKTLSKDQIEEIEDEYYTYIDSLKYEIQKYNKNIYYKKIDRYNYVIKIK